MSWRCRARPAPGLLAGVVHVPPVPEPEHIGDEPEGTELLLLAQSVGLVDVASAAMEDVPGELVAGLLAVELHEDPPALGRVGHLVQDGDRSADASDLSQRSGHRGRATTSLEGLNDLGGDAGLGVQGPGHPAHVVPVWISAVSMRRAERAQGAVVGRGREPEQPPARQVGQAGRVTEPEELAQPEAQVAGLACELPSRLDVPLWRMHPTSRPRPTPGHPGRQARLRGRGLMAGRRLARRMELPRRAIKNRLFLRRGLTTSAASSPGSP